MVHLRAPWCRPASFTHKKSCWDDYNCGTYLIERANQVGGTYPLTIDGYWLFDGNISTTKTRKKREKNENENRAVTHVLHPGLVSLELTEEVVSLDRPALDEVRAVRLVFQPCPHLML